MRLIYKTNQKEETGKKNSLLVKALLAREVQGLAR